MKEYYDNPPPLIPTGKYELKYEGHVTKKIFTADKVYLFFRVASFGPHFGTILARHCNCTLIGKPGWSGKFKAGWRSNLMREFVGVTGRRPQRNDRVPLSNLGNFIVVGTVTTVEKGSDQSEIHRELQYSVISRLEPALGPTPTPKPTPTEASSERQ